ncbi:MAG: hypothetical protein ABSG33_10095 [Candidatus Bathyarchaeia archaeon]|jgi:hypothetical protein
MAKTSLLLKCPYCNCDFEATPPDSLHFDYLFKEPPASSTESDVLKREVVCENPECGKTIKIYWYAPIEYFCRM